MGDYWFNVKTGQVEKGHQSRGANLMGPYDSAEEAARAYEIAREKTERWDAEDAAEEAEGWD